MQRKADRDGSATVPPIVHDVLRSPGQPLSQPTRAFFEPRFGHDFSKVRIHADTAAADSAQSVNAQAYTVGSQIVFGTGQYRPDSATGKRLLAHELTHVTQQETQRDGPFSSPLRLAGPADRAEREAKDTSAMIAGGGAAGSTASISLALQRQETKTPVAAGGPGAGGTTPAAPGHGVGASLCAAHPDELYYKSNPGYCQDTSSSGSLHKGFRCYREIPTGSGCPPGKHVCFDPATGKCDAAQSHIDGTAPSISRTSTGFCDLSWLGLCSVEHFFTDVIPDLLAEGTQAQVDCIENCDKTQPAWMKGFCMQGCTGGAPF